MPRSANLWSPHPVLILTGRVEKVDSQVLEIVESDGKRRKLPSDRIERIDVHWHNEAAASAHQRFVDRDYVGVLKNNAEVVRDKTTPFWQQCILLSEIVQSFEALNKPESAGKYFLLLAQQSPPDYLLATIPLNWTSREVTPTVTKAAREWLNDPNEYAGLLGASWLLLAEDGDAARQRLQKLQASTSKSVQRLAAMQLWRTVPPSETSSRMSRWLEARDSLSLPMQLGPSEFMAERFARVDNQNLAIGEWLRIAATYPQFPYRANMALQSASSRLSRNGDKTQLENIQKWQAELSGQ